MKLLSLLLCAFAAQAELRIAPFQADVTPAVGEPVAYVAARAILDPLSARGVVLLGSGKPIVLCAVDWIGIANDGFDRWRRALAEAAGTDPERVTVHTLHQHDAPRWDPDAERYLKKVGLGGKVFKDSFATAAMMRTAAAVRASLPKARRVTHIAIGKAKVEKVASNRRILGADGQVKVGRMSASRNPEAIAAPEGTIDPWLRLLSFWDGATPVASLTYYATHPQSYYGQGDVTAEFVGLARAQRERDVPGVAHIHFNGASGNVAAGKYNDGSQPMRPVLTGRMAAAMRAAWENTQKIPAPKQVDWRVENVKLPPNPRLDRASLTKTLEDPAAKFEDRRSAASHLSWLDRVDAGNRLPVTRLRLGEINILHLPGELFVEYQLAAQQMTPGKTVLMAAYSDYGPGYIGTAIAYGQGGYEVSFSASRVDASTEPLLLGAMRKLLEAK